MPTLTALNPAVKYFDDLAVDVEWVSEGRTVTESDVVTFATWSGDMHPLHTNAEYAAASQFGQRLFHGPGALALAFGLEMRLGWKMGSAIAFLGINEWTMPAPIFIGDTLHIRERITEMRPSGSKPDRGIVKTLVEIVNQNGVICQQGTWSVLLYRNAEVAAG